MEKYRGIYIFFDSRGRAIYVGKTEKQKLWKEIKDAFNRSRGDFQKIRRVKQPIRKQVYRNSNEKARQIVEALLVRCAANDLLNKRMERFSRQRHS